MPELTPHHDPLQVGQALWWVSRSSHHRDRASGPMSYPVRVTKVGRRWATLDNGYRVHRVTWQVDGKGYAPPGDCYSSRLVYETHIARLDLWKEIRHLVDDAPGSFWQQLSLAQLTEVRDILMAAQRRCKESTDGE